VTLTAPFPRPPGRRFWRWALLALVALPLLLALLILDFSPALDEQPQPTATQVAKVRKTLTRLKDAVGKRQPQNITLSWTEVSNLSQLGNQISDKLRFVADHDVESVSGQFSVRLIRGLWVNGRVRVYAATQSFPSVRMEVGRLSLSPTLSLAAIRLGRWLLAKKSVDLPPLDQLVSNLAISDQTVSVTATIPKSAKMFAVLGITPQGAANSDLVVEQYCRLAKLEQDRPDANFETQVKRSFDSVETAEQGRAALTALAMLTVSTDFGSVAGDIGARVKKCRVTASQFTLLGRQDLPKHWALSAALTANFGSDLSQAMGTWKEVSDSAAGGSGFSFVDLAADRSGTRIGKLVSADDTVAATAAQMRGTTQSALLPLRALALAEGMSEQEFIAQFTSIDSRDYNRMISRIDAVLDAASN
jgi:uncharacterized protein YfiM (DUF2279 family)